MIKATQRMEKQLLDTVSEIGAAHGGILAGIEAVLNMPEVREAFEREILGEVTEEPQEAGASVIDADGDTWVRSSKGGWGIGHKDGTVPWHYVLSYGPLRRLP